MERWGKTSESSKWLFFFFAWDFPAYSGWEMGVTVLLKVANRNRMFLHVRFVFN